MNELQRLGSDFSFSPLTVSGATSPPTKKEEAPPVLRDSANISASAASKEPVAVESHVAERKPGVTEGDYTFPPVKPTYKGVKADSADNGDGQNDCDFSNLKVGDILLTNDRTAFNRDFPPGYYKHCGMYVGEDKDGKKWSIQSTPRSGVHFAPLEVWHEKHNHCAVIRPMDDKGREFTPQFRSKAIEFAATAVGCKYERWWVNRKVNVLPVEKDQTKFYCSQLVWYSYYQIDPKKPVDLDPHPGFSFPYVFGVAPQELYDSKNTREIARDTNPD